jgi:hypothetical protein
MSELNIFAGGALQFTWKSGNHSIMNTYPTRHREPTCREACTAYEWSPELDREVQAWCTRVLRTGTWNMWSVGRESSMRSTYNCSVVEFDTQHQKTMFELVWSESLKLCDSSDAYFDTIASGMNGMIAKLLANNDTLTVI